MNNELLFHGMDFGMQLIAGAFYLLVLHLMI